MNIEEYISSGIVEAYVLGLATESEVREIRQLMEEYPRLRAAVKEQEDILVRYARQNALAPPPQLKETIWEALDGEKNLDESQPTIVEHSYGASASLPPSVLPLRRSYALAVSLVLLIASALANIWLLNGSNKKSDEIAALKQSQRHLSREKNEALATAGKMNETLKVLSLPKLVKINLSGTGDHAGQSALLYWDRASGDVFLDLNSMPQAPAGKQYRLWAIIDGKPVDAGFCTMMGAIIRMKTIARAEQFILSLDNSGGSPAAGPGEVLVSGKTS